jgi:hypothetical protein
MKPQPRRSVALRPSRAGRHPFGRSIEVLPSGRAGRHSSWSSWVAAWRRQSPSERSPPPLALTSPGACPLLVPSTWSRWSTPVARSMAVGFVVVALVDTRLDVARSRLPSTLPEDRMERPQSTRRAGRQSPPVHVARNRGAPVARPVATSRWSAPQRPSSPLLVARAIIQLHDGQMRSSSAPTYPRLATQNVPASSQRTASQAPSHQPKPAHVRPVNAHGDHRCSTPIPTTRFQRQRATTQQQPLPDLAHDR